MRKISFLMSLALGIFSLSTTVSCTESDDDSPKKVVNMLPQTRAMNLSKVQKAMIDDNNAFSFNLLQKVVETDGYGKSAFVSPIGVTNVLGMVQEGCNDEAQREISQVLGFWGKDKSQINGWCQALREQAPMIDPQVHLSINNVVFMHEGYHAKDSYTKNLEKYYGASCVGLDFSSPSALSTINGWCKEHTNGMIPSMVTNLKSIDVCYVLNAVFFDGKWRNKFDKDDTQPELFTSEDGEQQEVGMMHNQAVVNCLSDSDVSMVELPYGSGRPWEMIVALPQEGKTLADILPLMHDKLASMRDSFGTRQLDIKLPKFKLSVRNELKDVLQSMGVKRVFSDQEPSMTEMVDNFDGLRIESLLQGASIDVDEEGSKAQAVTVSEIVSDIENVYETGVFHANRPFVFFIVESNTNAVFFAGTYTGK